MSETAPVISSNALHKHKLGSSGFLVNNLDLLICDDKGNKLPTGQSGEIVVKGENIMAGYWNNPEATNKAFTNDWFHTGDLGYLDDDGFLYVLGRYKSLLISDDGEKYSPEGIEEALVNHSPYIEQCMLYNNQDPYTIALIYPNTESLNKWLDSHHLSAETEEGKKAVLELIQQEINAYKKGGKYENAFPERWLPATFGILTEGFTEENKLLNSTMKMVRRKITDRYKDLIKLLYTKEGKEINNKENIQALDSLSLH